MHRARRAVILCLCLVPQALLAQDAFKVIVNAKNPGAQVRRADLATLFLNRQARWGHGPYAAAVDRSAQAPIREAFSTRVLGKSVLAVKNYWQQKILNDRQLPPPVKDSDEDVIAYVAKEEGGVGYVSAEASLPPAVKELKILD